MPKPPKPADTPRVLPRRRHWKESKARKVFADIAASATAATLKMAQCLCRLGGKTCKTRRRSGGRQRSQ